MGFALPGYVPCPSPWLAVSHFPVTYVQVGEEEGEGKEEEEGEGETKPLFQVLLSASE